MFDRARLLFEAFHQVEGWITITWLSFWLWAIRALEKLASSISIPMGILIPDLFLLLVLILGRNDW